MATLGRASLARPVHHLGRRAHHILPQSREPHMFATIKDATLHYRSEGEGPPVVFLHALGGTANAWHGVMAAMEQHHHCVAVDLRGHGRSTGTGRFSVEGFADDVEGLVRHLELPSITLVGHSMGSLVAQHLAHRRQDLVSHLVLVGAISQFEPSTSDAYRARAERVEQDGLDELVDEWLAGAVSPQTHALQSGATGLLREMMLRNDPSSYAKATRAMAEASPVRRDELGQPTLILTGAHDRSTPLAMAEELHRSIPVSRVEVIPDVAHWSPVEAPGRIAASILEFLT